MSSRSKNFDELDLIKLNILMIAISAYFIHINTRYVSQISIFLTSFVGILISTVGFYIFHIRKLDNPKYEVLALRYGVIIYLNVLSLLYLAIGFIITLYGNTKINTKKYTDRYVNQELVAYVEISDILIIVIPIIILILLYKIFKRKKISSKKIYNIKIFSTVVSNLMIRSILYTITLVILYFVSKYEIV